MVGGWVVRVGDLNTQLAHRKTLALRPANCAAPRASGTYSVGEATTPSVTRLSATRSGICTSLGVALLTSARHASWASRKSLFASQLKHSGKGKG